MQIIIVIQNGKVIEVIADSDVEYREVNLDSRRYNHDLYSAELAQMENEEESESVARDRLLMKVESADLIEYRDLSEKE